MRKNYVILTHGQPELTLRLVERLDDGTSTFWIHLDASTSAVAWKMVVDHPAVRCVRPRVTCSWATWSIVEAAVAALRFMVREGEPGHVVLLSGQTYPIRSNAEIDAQLEMLGDAISMEILTPEELWPENPRDRLDYFNVPLSDRPGHLVLLRARSKMNARELVGWSRRLVREVGLRRTAEILRLIGRPRPQVESLVRGGSQWWAMPWDTVNDLLAFHDAHPEIADFLRWSQAPDELFFQTIVATMYGESLADRLRPSITFVDWTPGDWDLPRVLSEQDVPTLLALSAETLFARKFSPPCELASVGASR